VAAPAGNKNVPRAVYSTDGRHRRRKEKRLADRDEARKFEQSLLGWLDDAYNLARWLLRDDQDAVQDAFMRAMRYADDFRGGDRRAWLLAIVRDVWLFWCASFGADTL
jgi:DNA-directed RNA polymerase specialized sigma24 family protein